MTEYLCCYRCESKVEAKDLIPKLVNEDKILLEFTCPDCGQYTVFGFRDSWVYESHRA
jgi:hypothetical protein